MLKAFFKQSFFWTLFLSTERVYSNLENCWQQNHIDSSFFIFVENSFHSNETTQLISSQDTIIIMMITIDIKKKKKFLIFIFS